MGCLQAPVAGRGHYHIRYGQTYDNPDGMILVKAGISNGLMDILDFRQKDGEWKLVSYEN